MLDRQPHACWKEYHTQEYLDMFVSSTTLQARLNDFISMIFCYMYLVIVTILYGQWNQR